jgi:hypothetical protein
VPGHWEPGPALEVESNGGRIGCPTVSEPPPHTEQPEEMGSVEEFATALGTDGDGRGIVVGPTLGPGSISTARGCVLGAGDVVIDKEA